MEAIRARGKANGSESTLNSSMNADVTRLLDAIVAGDLHAGEELLPIVYGELRRLASSRMSQERAGHTLQPTALVHEAWMRLGDGAQRKWENRAHFFGAAAEAMRRILIDRARQRLAVKHGAGKEHVELDGLEIAAPTDKDDELLAVHEALDRFATSEPRKAELVKLRYFAGFSIEEAAEALNISAPTAKRDWAYARAWLFREIGNNRA